SDRMKWTPLNFDPPAPMGLPGAGGANLDALGWAFELLAAFVGKLPMPDTIFRGFHGMELADDDKGVVVKSVLEKGPAAQAGLKAGARLTEYRGRTVRSFDDVLKLAVSEKTKPGDQVKLTVLRDGKAQTITVKAGEGF